MSLSSSQIKTIVRVAQEHGVGAILAVLAAYAHDIADECAESGGPEVLWHRVSYACSAAAATTAALWAADRGPEIDTSDLAPNQPVRIDIDYQDPAQAVVYCPCGFGMRLALDQGATAVVCEDCGEALAVPEARQ